MADHSRKLDSLFFAALEIESLPERVAFLDESCGDDKELRGQIEKMLKSHLGAGNFLERPAPELQATVVESASSDARARSLQAGLAAAFTQEHAVLIGDANNSVLKSLGKTMTRVPRIALRESIDDGVDPIVRPSSSQMPQRDGDSRYRIDGEIARGGMGAILKGRDIDLGRDLAIKVLLDAHKDQPDVIQRFVEEAQIGGQLQHPGIARSMNWGSSKTSDRFLP